MRPGLRILDGGFGRELIARCTKGAPCENGTWGAWFSKYEPTMVKDLHKDFIHAGATICTTNTYSATPEVAEKLDMTLGDLIISSCELARDAISDSGVECTIAGSLPPLTSSHRPDLVLPQHVMKSQYLQILEHLAPQVDCILLETMSCTAEALAACEAASTYDKPIWVACEIRQRGRLVSREPCQLLLDRVGSSAYSQQVEAVLYNCSTIKNINDNLELLKKSANAHGW